MVGELVTHVSYVVMLQKKVATVVILWGKAYLVFALFHSFKYL